MGSKPQEWGLSGKYEISPALKRPVEFKCLQERDKEIMMSMTKASRQAAEASLSGNICVILMDINQLMASY